MSLSNTMPPAPQQPMIETIPRRRWIRLAVTYFLLGASALWYSPKAGNTEWWAHGLWCVLGFVVALPTLMYAFRRGFSVVLTDHRLMFLAMFSTFFLIGASLLAFGSDRLIQGNLGLYPIGPGDALRVDAVNGLGFGIALLTSALSRGRWLGNQAGRIAIQVSQVSPTGAVVAFLVIGTAATIYRLPVDLGLQVFYVPAIIRNLGQLSLVAIVLAASSRGRHERALRCFGVALTLLLVPVGALRLMKSEILMPVAALFFGLALRFGSRRVLPLGLTVLTIGYLMLGNVVNYGRGGMFNESSTLIERWSYLREGWQNAENLPESQRYNYWGRLCYVPTQAASLDFQDEGRGGNGMQIMWWVFVPRFLAPNKPQMTAMFGELNEKITGTDTSSNSPGIFAGGYYHAGWWGVWLASGICGWILAQTSAIARAIYAVEATILLPFALLGLFIASRIDGDFVPDYLGPFMFILYPLLAAALVLSVAGSKRPAQLPSS